MNYDVLTVPSKTRKAKYVTANCGKLEMANLTSYKQPPHLK
jgi:hypothetical protein